MDSAVWEPMTAHAGRVTCGSVSGMTPEHGCAGYTRVVTGHSPPSEVRRTPRPFHRPQARRYPYAVDDEYSDICAERTKVATLPRPTNFQSDSAGPPGSRSVYLRS